MRRAYLFIALGFLFMPFALIGCTSAPNLWTDAKPGQKKILVTFPPLYAITHAVAGPDAYVQCLLTTQGPHDYHGDAQDVLLVNGADLFIFNGLGLDDEFVRRMLKNHKNRSLRTLSVGDVLSKKHHELVIHEHHDDDKPKKPKPGHEGHDRGDHDPHIWLGPPQAITMTKLISDKLCELDPGNKEKYQKREKEFIAKLEKLHADGKKAFEKKKNKNIVTMHEAFAYFAHWDHGFEFDIKAVIQKKPGLDPDPTALAELVKKCKEENVAVIAVEPQYSTAQAEQLAKSLAKEGLSVKVVILDPLETAPLAKDSAFNPEPDYYLKKMRENIDTLAKALP